ncbi:MAG: formate C-acetyltransferase/glycerol dehydratase family glycyl radical enzyme [Caldithrix sp.]|nr:formate C-acetyltransferase/glycerol dehydratase family glycyl radical enzyme [Caldithrix sp.]
MNDRIKQLRKQTLQTPPTISAERAELLTQFYKSGQAERVSIPVARAMAFRYIMQHKSLCVNNGELIVGERGPAPKATPTYPEICAHSAKDLQILHEREKVNFKSDTKTRTLLVEDVKPFWEGRSIRDRILEEVDNDWKEAYAAGVFTEFMEQRAPGHTVAGSNIYQKGFVDFKSEIEESIAALDMFNDPQALDKREQLKAMDIAADALIAYARRYADKLQALADTQSDLNRKNELQQMAEICRHVPAHAPRHYWEALQHYWFIHLGVITELNTWDSFNPGRLDQHLFPFYTDGIARGTLTHGRAKELLMSFWIKFNNQPAPPKVGVTAQESNTYTDFCLINVGGVTVNGQDASNEMTYLILDVIEELRLLQPSSMVQISKKNPNGMVRRAFEIIKTGYGQPSLFNTDAIIQELVRQGKNIEDARQGGASGCVEAGAFGKESYILTGYFNVVKILELTLNNGVDPLSGRQIGLQTGKAADFLNYEELLAAFRKQLRYFINVKIKSNRIIERLYARYMPAPFLSTIIEDCIQNGTDYNAGGARYNTSYIQGVGMGTITDALSTLKHLVFDQQSLTMSQLLHALHNNFTGFDAIRDKLLNAVPKYGNDDDRADTILREVFQAFFEEVDGRPNTKGGYYRINLLPTTVHVYFGSKIGATPDGRLAGTPLSEGISPVQGSDHQGPTAVIKSASKIDHLRTGGTLLNQKFSPQVLQTEEAINKAVQLVRSYFRMDGHHIQFNVVTADTLRKARTNPEAYQDLIVRVAGYSDYFVDLTPELQEEIIRRTEQAL